MAATDAGQAVIAGHFGFAAGVKASQRQVPLWSLMLATAWLDVVFVPLYASGVETIESAPDAAPGYGAAIIHADYTHSLLGAIVLSAIFGAVFAWFWGQRTGVVLGLVSFSHWVLDLIVHRPDLPLLPPAIADSPRLGFGLWRLPTASMVIELAIVLFGSFLYWRAARETSAAAGVIHSTRADIAGAVVVVSGVVVLFFDYTGLLG